jgi:hypothetical protein
LAHYALIPQQYRDVHGAAPFVFSLNAVSRSGAQRRGFFSEIGQKIWGRAREQGVRAVIGVTNVNSTWPVRKQGWRVMGPMPVTFAAPSPRPERDTVSYDVTPEFLESDEFEAIADGLDESPAWHWTNRFTRSTCSGAWPRPTWRPTASTSATSWWRSAPARRSPASRSRWCSSCCPATAASVPSRANRPSRSAVIRADGRVRRPQPPRRGAASGCQSASPVPLNLVMLSLDEAIDQHTFQLDTFEFLTWTY